MSAKRKPKVLTNLEQANRDRGVACVQGSRHWKIKVNGLLVGIYPFTAAKEGFADNTKSQLRNAGLVVEGR